MSLFSRFHIYLIITICMISMVHADELVLNDQEYFEMPGLNVMVFHDFYPEGHQGGVSIIQNGTRVTSNGDVRLEPAPGQWSPVGKIFTKPDESAPRQWGRVMEVVDRKISKDKKTVSVHLAYPDSARMKVRHNPLTYPEGLEFNYNISVKAEGASFRIIVDLDRPLPDEWANRAGFIMELYPGEYFNKSWMLDGKTGFFPRQLDGPLVKDKMGELQSLPMATGKNLTIAPEDDSHRLNIKSLVGDLQLLDGRNQHTNGWYVLYSPIGVGKTKNAVEWVVTPSVLPNWWYKPVIQISQVGYRTKQAKKAFIECDKRETKPHKIELYKIQADGERTLVKSVAPENWGTFLRYQYYTFDFSDVTDPGFYLLSYGETESHVFQVQEQVFDRHVWQPTLEYFLPVQMCHMRVNDRYRVWHDYCHLDDALMAPTNIHHLDSYQQGPTTLSDYKSGDPVPGLNVGGWHDAGDYDLRVESQSGTVHTLALAYEEFGVNYDQTMIDQKKHLVELHQPDGKADVLQQVEHGVLAVLGGYRNLGPDFRGIIASTMRQYVMIADASCMTDNLIYNPKLAEDEVTATESGKNDDRWVFTEENPGRNLQAATGLAAASRVLKDYNPALSKECIETAEALYEGAKEGGGRWGAMGKVGCLVELIITTNKDEYKKALMDIDLASFGPMISNVGGTLARVMPYIDNKEYKDKVYDVMKKSISSLAEQNNSSPYGVPYRPSIWGDGWNIQRYGMQQYFMYKTWPDLVPADNFLNALNFVLGCHPGQNNSSFASGVGAKSPLVAYGFNRADWSYIPGGVISGTAIIRPDFAELKEWPFFWQQTEYVLGGGATNFMFLVLAADHLAE